MDRRAFSLDEPAAFQTAGMKTAISTMKRRTLLASAGLAAVTLALPARGQAEFVLTLADLGIAPGDLAGPALQRALDVLHQRGGGTLRIGAGTYRGGILEVKGENITIDGGGAILLDTRLVIATSARGVVVRDLNLLETRGQADSYLLEISGSDCSFTGLSLTKRPATGGYQAYLRGTSRGCRFDGLRLDGSNGVFVAGRDHLFENFAFTSTLRKDIGGDDAFAIKAAGHVTQNIIIRRGTVTGFSAAVSIGSEIGSHPEHPGAGVVRDVLVQDVAADRCQMVCFIKPGALIYDWRDGLVENVTLDNITLRDRTGFHYARGLAITAARGARVTGVTARGIVIDARAASQGKMPTSAIDIAIRADLPAATIENIDLQVSYAGTGNAGFTVDHIVRIEKDDANIGIMRGIDIDITGSDARIAGIYVGPGLDDAVTIRRARLERVALAPPSVLGAAGVWADSRLRLRDVEIDVVRGPARGGAAR